MPNTTPKCHYDGALGSSERAHSHAERPPLLLHANRLPTGAVQGRPLRTVTLSILCAALLAGWYASSAVLFAAEPYEAPPIFKASQLFPSRMIKGPNHEVDERVLNDGYMNHYKIHTRFGDLDAASTAELKIRIDEANALAAMEKVKGTQQFSRFLVQGGKDTLAGAKALITRPVETVSGAVSGVGKLFERAGTSLLGNPPSDAEDSRLQNLIGFSSTKRDYAAELGVDPYSSDPVLQKRLDEIAWAGYAGKITASAALSLVSGGAGIAISTSKTSNWLAGVPLKAAPADLRARNHKNLTTMGVSPEVVDLFLANTVYTPVQQTKLVNALAEMQGVGDRGRFVKFAVLTRDPEVAFFRARQAEMYARFHKRVSKVKQFVPLGELAAARLADGTLVFCAPLDHLAWTQTMANYVLAANQNVTAAPGIKAKQLQVAGTVSPLARAALEQHGWKIQDRQEGRLID
ncbi:MAG: hypothetical protein ACT4QB_14675 [Gammaproteobacteria bacterium]